MIRKFTINGTEVEISFNAKTHRYTITINGVKTIHLVFLLYSNWETRLV